MESKISIGGSVISLCFGWVGHMTLNSAALVCGIVSAILTMLFTMYRWVKELYKDFKDYKATK